MSGDRGGRVRCRLPICPQYPGGPYQTRKFRGMLIQLPRTCLETGEGGSDVEEKVDCQQTTDTNAY